MSESQKPNPWSRGAAPHAKTESRVDGDNSILIDWRLAPLSGAAGSALFEAALAHPLLRVITFLARRRSFVLTCGLPLIAAAVYCLAAPSGSVLAGVPVEFWSIALAGAAILLVLLVTLGAWLRPLESVEDAVEVLGVPLVAFEKGGTPDVR